MREELSFSRMNAPSSPLPSVLGLTRSELVGVLGDWGFSPVHASTLWSYLYWECADSWAAMPGLPAKVRTRLEENYSLIPLSVDREAFSSDGHTRKFLLGLEDARRIETVLMKFTGRATACISSQVGCAMGCVFCATGQMGYQRHLGAGEIVGQALHVQRLLRNHGVDTAVGHPAGAGSTGSAGAMVPSGSSEPSAADTRLRNVVLMGMGEPLHNYDAVLRAVDILRDQSGFAIAGSRITLSTVGVIPGIIRLADEERRLHLAVSLHGATQEEREALVPVARRWPLDALMEACRYYTTKLQRRIFFEWTLIDGVNDSPEHARAVGRLVSGMPAQVNLIPLNPTGGFGGAPTRGENARRFQSILAEEFSLPSTVRQRRGIDIGAGCGQLASGD
jgi:23S rRNA (adenine2503-C2)-methyltransferase